MSTDVELRAREANNPERWDTLWGNEGEGSWRKDVMAEVYDRLVALIPKGSKVIDIGGGRGFLAQRLRDEKECTVEVWDISSVAIDACLAKGIPGRVIDLEQALSTEVLPDQDTIIVATECVEHLSANARDFLFQMTNSHRVFFSVPNDCLGPDVEPQHTVQYTAMSFKNHLKKHQKDVRVEVLGPYKTPFVGRYLLGIGGFEKAFTLSFTMPVRNEEKDIERVLASFRGVADEIVIGIDCRSTDTTREICEKYCDVVFTIDDPQGPPEDLAPKVHFSHIRNLCMNKCTSDWIFMSEGHESLKKGQDTLLQLDKILPKGTKVAYVWRTCAGQRWAFPWLTSGKDTRIRYHRQTHNDLNIPDDVLKVKLPAIETWHFRDHAAELARKAQRKVQNRVSLMDDWLSRGSHHSLFYLASEWREFNPEKAQEYFHKFLESDSKIGDAKYQTRLIVAKEHARAALTLRDQAKKHEKKGQAAKATDCMSKFADHMAQARATLIPATSDNWARSEHWLWLGDISAEQELWDEALQFYKYAATMIGNPPFVLWWIDDDAYGHWPAQRLSETYANLGEYDLSLYWAQQVVELLPPDSPPELLDEAKSIIKALEEELRNEHS